jgi:hypothetical protein
MSLRYFAIGLMILGAALAALGMAMPLLPAATLVDDQQVEEFSTAAKQYHDSISVPFADREGNVLKEAKARFEAAKETIERARQRSKFTERALRIGGLLLLLTGGVLHLALSNSQGSTG